MPAIQIRGPEGLYACSISILVTIWYPHHVLTCCQQPDQNCDPNISQISEPGMMNVMLRPPTGTGSNLCDKCDGVQSQDDNLEHPSSWMSYQRIFSVRNGIIEGWGLSRPLTTNIGWGVITLSSLDDLDRWLICEWWCDCDVVWRTSVPV